MDELEVTDHAGRSTGSQYNGSGTGEPTGTGDSAGGDRVSGYLAGLRAQNRGRANGARDTEDRAGSANSQLQPVAPDGTGASFDSPGAARDGDGELRGAEPGDRPAGIGPRRRGRPRGNSNTGVDGASRRGADSAAELTSPLLFKDKPLRDGRKRLRFGLPPAKPMTAREAKEIRNRLVDALLDVWVVTDTSISPRVNNYLARRTDSPPAVVWQLNDREDTELLVDAWLRICQRQGVAAEVTRKLTITHQNYGAMSVLFRSMVGQFMYFYTNGALGSPGTQQV